MLNIPFKKAFITTIVSTGLTLGFYDSAYAYLNGNSCCVNKYGHWYVGADALYGIVNNQDFFYDILSSTRTPSQTTPNINNVLHTHYHWGYDVQVGYFLNNSDDITLNYLGFNNIKDSNLFASAKYSLNVLNAQLGHEIYCGNWLVHPFGGIEYVRITRSFNVFIPSSSDFNLASNSFFDFTDQAIGPRFGFDGRYYLDCNFAIAYGAAGGLLYNTLSQNEKNLNFSDSHAFAWTADAKMGLAYLFRNFEIEGGYKIFSFHQGGQATIEQREPTAVPQNTVFLQSSGLNFAVGGPYLGVKITD